MIQRLIDTALARLRDELTGLPGQPEERVVAGPVETPKEKDLPVLALYAGALEISQTVKEPAAGAPRPRPARRRLELGAGLGPYVLDHAPLRGTTRGTLILDEDALSERRRMLAEGKDFEIDYAQPAVSLLGEAPPATAVLLLVYSFPGVFTTREFRQKLHLDVFAADGAAAEKWASLAAGTLLTHLDELLAGAQTEYQSGKTVSTTHTVERLELAGGTPGVSQDEPSIARLQLAFDVGGRLELVREIPEGAALIERIHSPGTTSAAPVDIDVEIA